MVTSFVVMLWHHCSTAVFFWTIGVATRRKISLSGLILGKKVISVLFFGVVYCMVIDTYHNAFMCCLYLSVESFPHWCVPTAFWLACFPKLLALCLTQVALAARPLASCHVSHWPWGWELLSALWNKQVIRGLVLQFELPDSVIRCVFVASPLRQNMMATSQPRSISLVHLTCQLITGCCYLSLNKTLN